MLVMRNSTMKFGIFLARKFVDPLRCQMDHSNKKWSHVISQDK